MKEVDPNETSRAYAYRMWMKAPMPMVTLFKTLDVTHIVKQSRKYGLKFNMLICYCIGNAASAIREFYMLPVGDKLIEYDRIAISVIVVNKKGEINSCDIPFSPILSEFNDAYNRLTREVMENCTNYDILDRMVIGTSALAQYDVDGAVGMYSGIFNNPFLIWGRYRKSLFKATMKISFQFHHTQMDGAHAACFLDKLQKEIDTLLHSISNPVNP